MFTATHEQCLLPGGPDIPTEGCGCLHEQLATVRDRGIDVQTAVLDDPAGPTETEQADCDALIADLEARTTASLNAGSPNPNLLFDDATFPGMPNWLALRKSALALHPIYGVDSYTTLGGALTGEDFQAPLIGESSAIELLTDSVGADRAATIQAAHARFLREPLNGVTKMILRSTDDGRGVRTRASAATRLVVDALAEATAPIRVASLACGAAGPVAQLVRTLQGVGKPVTEMLLLDRDPMALAAGRTVAANETQGVPVIPQLVDLRRVDLRRELGDDGADVIDILGLFEYFPDDMAVALLKAVRAALSPQGVCVVGNMLPTRRQNVFFRDVLQWPGVVPRSLPSLVDLLEAAGWRASEVTALVPTPHVYGVFALRRES